MRLRKNKASHLFELSFIGRGEQLDKKFIPYATLDTARASFQLVGQSADSPLWWCSSSVPNFLSWFNTKSGSLNEMNEVAKKQANHVCTLPDSRSMNEING